MFGWTRKSDPAPSPPPPKPAPESDPVMDMLVEEARTRIDRQFSNNDAHDVKAAAVLAAVGVIAPVVISSQKDYGPSWGCRLSSPS